MAYNPPTISATGLTIPSLNDIQNFLIQAFQSIYGSTAYVAPDTSDGQEIAIRSQQASDIAQAIQAVYNSLNPQTAIGVSLDLIGKLIGTARKQASFSTVLLTISGTVGTIINNGIVQDTGGNFWNLPGTVTVGSGGTASVIAQAQILGAVIANASTVTIIATPTSGWTGVTNAAAANPGEAVEPDSAYRARLLIAQAKPSLSLLAGTEAAVGAVANVTRSVVYENQYGLTAGYGLVSTSGTAVTLILGYPFDSSDNLQSITISGVTYTIAASGVSSTTTLTLTTSAGTQTAVPYFIGDGIAIGPAHSITAVVEGGSPTAIAQAIYNNKNPGVLTNGTTSEVITDPINGGLSLTISFDVLTYVEVYVALNVHGLVGFQSAMQAAIQAALLSYLDSLGIGETIVFSQLYQAATSVMPNPLQPVFSIRSIISGAAVAPPTSSILVATNPVITVTSATGIATGQVAVGTGIPANTTVSSVSGTSITLSAAPTASATVPVTFFLTGTVDLPVPYNESSISAAAQIVVNLV